MAEYVNHIQGSKENYNPSEMQGGIYFSKDTKEILLNGDSYGNATPADEEDVTSKSGVIKLADRVFDEANFSGKGYTILRKNILEVTIPKFDLTISSGCTTNGTITVTLKETPTLVEVTTDANTPEAVALLILKAISGSTIKGSVVTFTSNPSVDYSTTGVQGSIADNSLQEHKNILTLEMINKSNTIYEIRYDYDLNGATINILEDSFILFKGGSFKNGTILFRSNSNIINITSQTIFYDIIFSNYSLLSINCHFIDNWHNNPMLGANGILVNVPHFYFTTDYVIEDNAHFQHGTNYKGIPHYLHGNGHSITMLSHNFTGKSTFMTGESISIDNLTIICKSNDTLEHIGTIFNCRNLTADNLKFDAYNRLLANWSFADYADHDNSFLILRNCDIKTSSFVVEDRFDKVYIINTQLHTRTDRSDYGHDILSLRAYNSNPTVDNAYIFIDNCFIEGGIELVGSKPEARTNTYKKVTVLNSVLRYFRLGFHGGLEYGITDMEVVNCTSYVGKGNGFYNGINSVTYKNCNFYLTTYNNYSLGPFKIMSMREFTFDSCTFKQDISNTTVHAPICETHIYSNYPEDFADTIKINIVNCIISTKWLGSYNNACIDLRTQNIVFTDAQAEQAITIINTSLCDIDANDIECLAKISYGENNNVAYPVVLPINNFKISYELLPRLKLNMLKGTNIHGELRSHSYNVWGMKSIPVTYVSDIRQFVQDNGISWNSLRPLI